MERKQVNPKTLIIGFVAFCIVIIASFLIYWVINKDKTASIHIFVAPINATVKIGEKTYPTNKTIKIEPGTYPVVVTTEKIPDYSFKDYSGTIEAKDGETVNLYVVLEEDDDKNYYETHEEDSKRIEEIRGAEAKAEQEKYTSRDPIFAITPFKNYNDGYFVIPTLNYDNSITVTISLLSCIEMYRDDAKSAAISWMNSQNLNVDNYEIVYKNACTE